MKELNKHYEMLKFDYFGALQTKKLNRGDLRAFVGLTTWINERGALANCKNEYEAHVVAFEEAVGDAQKIDDQITLTRCLSESIKLWQADGEELSRNGTNPLFKQPIPEIKRWHPNGFTAISLFSGAMGLDLGFLAAGFDIRLANDIDKNSSLTIQNNLPKLPFIHKDFTQVTKEEVLKTASLEVGEVDLLVGGPPCQPFSPAGRRQSFNDPRASPLKSFIKTINDVQPKAFVMEEVPGLLSSRLQHVSISERDKRALLPEEERSSAFNVVLEMLNSTGYNFTYGILNSADFGAPQVRRRLIFIGLRKGQPSLPKPSFSTSPRNEALKPWNTFWQAVADIQGKDFSSASLSHSVQKYMKYVSPGGYWRHLPQEIIPEAMGGAYKSGGGKMGFYRRLCWDEPSPTVVTSPVQKSTLFVHPEAMRPLSVEEYKRVQGFPDDWKLAGSTNDRYRLIGDAVPVYLSYAIAKHVLELLEAPLEVNKQSEVVAYG